MRTDLAGLLPVELGFSADRPQYRASEDGFHLAYWGRWLQLCDFVAWVVTDVVDAAGDRQFLVGGRTATANLPPVWVPARRWRAGGWILPAWGSAAHLAAGHQAQLHVPVAIGLLSAHVGSVA